MCSENRRKEAKRSFMSHDSSAPSQAVYGRRIMTLWKASLGFPSSVSVYYLRVVLG
jgi:hypothetical protein